MIRITKPHPLLNLFLIVWYAVLFTLALEATGWIGQQISGLSRILIFFSWISAFSTTLSALGIVVYEADKKKRTAVSALWLATRAVIGWGTFFRMLILVWSGWWATAIAACIELVMFVVLVHVIDVQVKKQKEEQQQSTSNLYDMGLN